MEGLRPDRDEVDNFQRSRKSGKTGKATAKPSAKPSLEVRPNKARASAPKRGASISVWLMMVVIASVVSWLGWEGYQQQQRINAMTAELNDALVFIRQSKLLMARFEGQLSETDAELEESDTGAQKKMKFLESEIRKLWGIAYDRNRKAIAASDELIKEQAKELKNISASLKKQTQSMADLATKTDKSVTSAVALQSEVILLRELNDQLSAQLKAIEDASSSAIAEIRQSVEALKNAPSVEGRVRMNEVAIEAIDASRLQLNERIVALDRRLNDLQLSVKSAQPTTKTAP
ncbi:hypothetical protein [Alkalimarinus sediminis]|uniref:Uncharacterized protein n=1 Tax=Alkalimarinus sediminis TaxID=1632866 RepID=A0A9E8HLT5_9ALTE|nr:hypothetical protein [Alkalimarinus sediminis]UZW75702.1 hypothetical protein NNL22_03665 [Alkalimarinus sediminis]